MRRGWRILFGSGFSYVGGAKQKMSVLKINLAPFPVPKGSLLTPTIPVRAPPYGSRAEGELCVSTLNTRLKSSLNLIIPALSTNTDRHQSSLPMLFLISFVDL